MSTFDLTQKVKIVNPNASNDSQYGPYNSIGEALTETEGLRELGRTVGIIESGVITEYWFKEGITDEDLIPKTTGSNGGGGYFKEITKDGAFRAEKINVSPDVGKYRFIIEGDETLEWTIGDTDYVYNLGAFDRWAYVADALGPNVQRRIDAVSYGNDGQIHYWKGTETGQASYPNVPETHILKTFVTLTEDGASTIPNTFDPTWLLRTDANWDIKSIPSGDSKIILGNVVYFGGRAFKIVDSEEDSTITGIAQYSTPTLTNIFLGSDGVMIHLWNDSENDITIKNFPTGAYSTNGYRFWFPIEGDYILKPNEVIYFKWHRVGLNPVTIDYNLSKFIFLGSNMSSGGATGDFIPLSGTEVGKPLTGEIEVDTTNDFVGFYSEEGGVERRISMTDDGYNVIQNTVNSTNERSEIENSPQNTRIITTDADGNLAEIVVGDYGTVRFNSDMPDEGYSSYMYFNSEDGLQIRDNNSYDYNSLRLSGIDGQYNTNNWIIEKSYADTGQTNLLLPDSGFTPRRIPVSVNGNYANQQGDISLTNLTPDGTNNLIDVDNKLNPVYLPPNIMHLQGEWNAATNTPTLSNGTGIAGYIYEVTTAGTTDFGDGDKEFALGDWVVYGGDGKWYNSPNTGEVVGVKGDNESNYRKGLVNIDIDDVIAPTANEFLVGNSAGDDWEKRGLVGSDFDITTPTPNRVLIWSGNTNTWLANGLQARADTGFNSIALRTGNGILKANPAIESDDLVPLGQLNTVLEDYIQEPTTDGTSGQVLTTDGSGSRSWTTPPIGITELTGDVTTSGSGSVVATIADNAVTPEKLSKKDYVRFGGGINWNPVTAPENNSWYSVAYGDGKFVAVSTNGTNRVMYSTNGTTWLSATAAADNTWRSVTYGNGKFVAVAQTGTNRAMYSSDGITWNLASIPADNQWYSVTYGNGKFVAVSSSGTNRVMYSTDGITWTSAPVVQYNSWRSVTYGNGKFVAVAVDGTNRAMYSTDGITWTMASTAEANQWYSVTYGGGKFVATSGTGTNRVMYSSDGITWLPATAAEANYWVSVTYGDGKFVAVSFDGTNRVMYSSDGITWTSASATESNGWQSVTYGNGKFVAVANSGTNRVMYSEGGLNFDIPTSALINDGDGDSPFITEAQADSKYVEANDLSSVAFSGSYNDLDDLPTIPAQVNLIEGSNITITGSYPNLTVSASGTVGTDWDDIGGDQSDVNLSGFTNDSGFTTNTGTVTSVGLSVPTGLSVSNSPVTTSGTIGITYASGYQGYTTTEASKLSGIEAGAQVNVNADWNATSGDAQILNKPSLLELGETSTTAYRGDRGKIAYDHTSLTNNPHNVTKAQVGLGNVDDTSDLDKPISTATQNALNTKADDNAVVKLSGNQTVAGVKTFSSSPIVPTATTPTQAVNLGQMTLQGVLDNNNIADGVGIMLTDGSELGQYTVDGFHANSGSIGMSASVTEKGFLYSDTNGRVHLGNRDGVVGLNFENNLYKVSLIPANINGNHTHTLQAKSGVLAHLDDIGDVADGSITNAKLTNMPANSIKGRAAASAGEPSDIAISASRLVGRGSMGNLTGLTVGGGLSFSGTQLNSDVYRDNYQTSPDATLDNWIDDRVIYKMTFTGTSTGVEQIDLSALGIDSIILIEGIYVEKVSDREVPCNYQRLLDPETNTDMEITSCYRDISGDRLRLSWHDIISGTPRPVEFTYKVTIKYVK